MTVITDRLDEIALLHAGSHDEADKQFCLLEAARAQVRYRADGRYARGTPPTARLWGAVVVAPSGCWERPGSSTSEGYTSLKIAGRSVRAHRAAWEFVNGPAGDLDVCHRCDNPPCVNPDHLFLGTHADNNADRHAKGRTVMPTNGPDFWRNKTHCPQGHAYSGSNVRYRKNGRRYCGECSRVRSLNYIRAHRKAS